MFECKTWHKNNINKCINWKIEFWNKTLGNPKWSNFIEKSFIISY